jgi:hypothetical protein
MPGQGLSSRAIALAALALAVVGILLIFDRDDEPGEPATARPESSGHVHSPSAPESHWSPGQQENHAHSPLPALPAEPTPTSSPTAPEPTASATPGGGGGAGQPTEPPADPHVHRVPSKKEADAAPPPEFTHEFDTDVPRELANHVVKLAWRWLLPRLERDGWAHLKLVQHGVLEVAADDSKRPVKVAAELGHSGATGLGQVGVGKITTVWLELKADGKWKVIGVKDGPLRGE